MSQTKPKVTPKEVPNEVDVSSSLDTTKRDLLTKKHNLTTNSACPNTTVTVSTKTTAAATTTAKAGAVVAGKAGFLAGMTTVKLIIIVATVMGCIGIIVGVTVGVSSNKNRE